jgi:hypothetical protein
MRSINFIGDPGTRNGKATKFIFVAFLNARAPGRVNYSVAGQMLARNAAQVTVDVCVITPSPLAL